MHAFNTPARKSPSKANTGRRQRKKAARKKQRHAEFCARYLDEWKKTGLSSPPQDPKRRLGPKELDALAHAELARMKQQWRGDGHWEDEDARALLAEHKELLELARADATYRKAAIKDFAALADWLDTAAPIGPQPTLDDARHEVLLKIDKAWQQATGRSGPAPTVPETAKPQQPWGVAHWLVAGLDVLSKVNQLVPAQALGALAGCKTVAPVATTSGRREELALENRLNDALARHHNLIPDEAAGLSTILGQMPGYDAVTWTLRGLASELWTRAIIRPAGTPAGEGELDCQLPAVLAGVATQSPAVAAGVYAVCSQIPGTRGLKLTDNRQQFKPFTEQQLANLTLEQLARVPTWQDTWWNGLEVTYYMLAPGIVLPDVINPVDAYSTALTSPQALAKLGFWSTNEYDRFRALNARYTNGTLTEEKEKQEHWRLQGKYARLQGIAPKVAREVLVLSGHKLLRAYTRQAKLHAILRRQGTPDAQKLIDMLGTIAVVAPWQLGEKHCPALAGTNQIPQVCPDPSDTTGYTYVFNAAVGVTGNPQLHSSGPLRGILAPSHEGVDVTTPLNSFCAASVYGSPSVVQIDEDSVLLLVRKGRDGRNVAVFGPDRKLLHEYMHVHQNLAGLGKVSREALPFRVGWHFYETPPNEAYAVGGDNLTVAMWKAEHPSWFGFLTTKREILERRVKHSVIAPHTEAANRAETKRKDAEQRVQASHDVNSKADRLKRAKAEAEVSEFKNAGDELLAKMRAGQQTIRINEHTAYTASARRDTYDPRCDDSRAVSVGLPISDDRWDYVTANEERTARTIADAVRGNSKGQLRFDGWASGGMAARPLASHRVRRVAHGRTGDSTCSLRSGQTWLVSFGDSFQGEGSRHVGIPELPQDSPATLLTHRLLIEGEQPGVYDPNMMAFSGLSSDELYVGTYHTLSGAPGCHQALWSPARLATGGDLKTVQFGCSGATTHMVLTDTPGKGQINQFNEWWERNPGARPQVVDISIGGNDLDVSSILKWCIATDLLEVHDHSLLRAPGFRWLNKCDPDGPLKDADNDAYHEVTQHLVEVVQKTMGLFTQRKMTYGDDYRIVLKSYPQIFPPDDAYQPSHPTLWQETQNFLDIAGRLDDLYNNRDDLLRVADNAESVLVDLLQLIYPRAVAGGFPVDAQSANYLRRIGGNLNLAVKTAAYLAGVDFLDLTQAFAGHELGNKKAQFQKRGPDQIAADGGFVTTGLTPVSQLHWVNPLILTEGAQGHQESFHPGFLGYLSIGSAMNSFYRQVLDADGLVDGTALVDSSSNPGRTTVTASPRDSGHGLYRLTVTDIKHVKGQEYGGTSELFGGVVVQSPQKRVLAFFRERKQWKKYREGESMLQDDTPVEVMVNGGSGQEKRFEIAWKIFEADGTFFDPDDDIGAGQVTVTQRQLDEWRAAGTLACHKPHVAAQAVEGDDCKVEIHYKIERIGGECVHVPPPTVSASSASYAGETPTDQREREEAALRLKQNTYKSIYIPG
ncbi:hypothetical protein ACWEQ8_20825 [Streptomyces noursei]